MKAAHLLILSGACTCVVSVIAGRFQVPMSEKEILKELAREQWISVFDIKFLLGSILTILPIIGIGVILFGIVLLTLPYNNDSDSSKQR